MSDEEVAKWDQWFEATGDSNSIKTWAAVKRTISGHKWVNWAYIIELNRLEAKVAVRQ